MAQTPEEVAARQAIEAQHLARDDRLLASQRTAVDSAKLVSTFVLALAGTLVGTALQVERAGGELTALIFMGVSLLCVLAVILLDQIDIPTFENDTLTTTDDVLRQEVDAGGQWTRRSSPTRRLDASSELSPCSAWPCRQLLT